METRTDICTPKFIAALVTVAKRWKEPRYPLTDEWISKTRSLHTVENYLALERNQIMTRYNMGDLGDITLSEINQSQESNIT